MPSFITLLHENFVKTDSRKTSILVSLYECLGTLLAPEAMTAILYNIVLSVVDCHAYQPSWLWTVRRLQVKAKKQ